MKRSVGVGALLLCMASLADASIYTVTATGTLSESIAVPNPVMNAPFTLVFTIDDTKGQITNTGAAGLITISQVEYAVTPSTISNPVTAAITYNGRTQTIGIAQPTFAEGIAQVETETAATSLLYQVNSVPGGDGNSVYLLLGSPGPIVQDFRMPYTYTVQHNDTVTAYFLGNGASGALTVSTISLAAGGTPAPTPITPQVGLWWNPAESGSGYALDYKHGVLVATVYSYTMSGAPLWYIASGPVTNNTFTGPLLKTQNGQCISCVYQVFTANGDDGMMTITFSSPTTATMTLPGGRNFQIVPQDF